MKWRELLPNFHPLHKEPEPENREEYSFCESVAAYVWHIRPLTARGRKLSGGADTPSLCGMKVSWDINSPVKAYSDRVRDGRGHGICSKCLAIYRSKQ